MIAKLFPSMTTLAWCGLALCAASAAMAQERTPTAQDVLAKDLRVLLEYFPGRYDNDLQVYFDGELKTPEIERNGRIHSIFAPVTLPAFGPNMFYVEQYADNDPNKIYRQRLYRFSVDAVEKAIKLEILRLQSTKHWRSRGHIGTL
ncbi:MAG: CpcT/CpeT family chromophore lyase [Hyphomonadaceae bacterium]